MYNAFQLKKHIMYHLSQVHLVTFRVLIHVEQLSRNAMMPKEAQFAEILSCLNQSSVAHLPILLVLGISGACYKRHNIPQHVIVNSDLERVVINPLPFVSAIWHQEE